MAELAAALPPHDGVAVFNGVYLSVTRELDHRWPGRRGGLAAELGGRFAARYLTAVTGPDRPPACWRPLLELRGHPGVHAVQFALAGINAHVGHDLALSVVETAAALGLEPPALETDFDRVGAVLDQIEERVRERLMPGPDLLERADPLTHLIGCWSLDRARDAAWCAARLLWALRAHPEAYAECATTLDSTVGLLGRALLTPLGAAAPVVPVAPAVPGRVRKVPLVRRRSPNP
jgi:hypothetical protein